ncbi:protein transport protein bos1 [Borealophlyctis nickersoniae]|nr:protein transport protein bos1 [Borealophlyctis nickersoniae]
MSATVLYNNTVKQIHTLQGEVERLEAGEDTSPAIQGQIAAGLSSLKRAADDMEDFARREVTAVKREKALARAAKFREDFNNIKAAFDRWKANERARAWSEINYWARGGERQQDIPLYDDRSSILTDYATRESEALSATGARIDDFINMGRAALQDLYEQRSILKGTQRRVLDVANTLGLSTTVIRYIEQRTASDAYILFGGIVVTVLVMWAIVHYLG